MEVSMGARLMNARKKKKRLAHRDARQKQRAQVAEAAPQPATKSKPRKGAG
jgi:hypothetical protein